MSKTNHGFADVLENVSESVALNSYILISFKKYISTFNKGNKM